MIFPPPHLIDSAKSEFAPILMGIVNVTPDSFSGDGRAAENEAVKYAQKQIEAGADFLDVGGESTRPAHTPISFAEESARVIPVIKNLAQRAPQIPISIDTAKIEIAAAGFDAGATIFNNTSVNDFANNFERDALAAKLLQTHPQVSMILMHRPHSQTELISSMADDSTHDIVQEVYQSLSRRLDFFMAAGIEKTRLALDVGLGFGKSVEDNWRLVQQISKFHALGAPLVVGHSRKRFLRDFGVFRNAVRNVEAETRLDATLAVSIKLAADGVQILRVHDINAHRAMFGTCHFLR